MRTNCRWVVGEYVFIEHEDNRGEFGEPGKLFYRFTREGARDNSELYPSLDHALVAAVGEKYTGPRGAGGSGVDTAAGWFMKMIGAVPTADES